MLTTTQTLAARQLSELRSDVRLVVIHPNFTPQHTLIKHFGESFFYVRFDGTSLSSDQLWSQVEAAVEIQSPDDFTTILLDECDRAEPDALVYVLRRLLEAHSTARIVIFTRATPAHLLKDSELRPLTQFVPTNDQTLFWNYLDRADKPSTLLEVYALGAGRVLMNGNFVHSWDGLLPRALFFFLIDRGMVTRSEIFETFWPNLPVREATNVFHVTKRKINEVLKTDLTVYWSGFYHISPKIQLSYDVALFNQLLQDSSVAVDSTELLTHALSLYQGDFLSQMHFAWVKPRRQSVRQTYSDALVGLGRAAHDNGDHQRALTLYLRAMTINRTQEELVEKIMRLCASLNLYSDGLRCYENLAADLLRMDGREPSVGLRELAAVLRG